MKLIWHIVKKDLRRERWGVGAWALLFVAEVGLGFSLRWWTGGFDRLLPKLALASVALATLQLVVTYLLALRWTQEDGVVGENRFWTTRPIGGGRLLAAKLGGTLAVLAGGPVVLLLPLWLSCGFSGPAVLWAAVETAAWQAAVILPALAVASLTDSARRALVWSVVGLLAMLVWGLFLLASRQTGEAITARLLAGRLAVSGTAVAVTAHQFLTRRWGRSLAILAGGLGLAIWTGQARLWAGAGEGVATEAAAESGGDQAGTETLKLVWVKTRAWNGRRTSVNTTLDATGVPERTHLAIRGARQTWSWPDGVVFQREKPDRVAVRGWNLAEEIGWPEGVADAETEAFLAERRRARAALAAQHGARVEMRRDGSMDVGLATDLPASILAKMMKEPAAYRVNVRGALRQTRLADVLPLRVGAEGHGREREWRVTEVVVEPAKVRASVMTFSSPLVNERLWWWSALGRTRRATVREDFAFGNRVRPELAWFETGQTMSYQIMIAGVVVRGQGFTAAAPKVRRDGKWVVRDARWAEGMEIVLTEDREVAEFVREVQVEKLTAVPATEKRLVERAAIEGVDLTE